MDPTAEICTEDDWQNPACEVTTVTRLLPTITIENPVADSFVATERNGLGIIRIPVTGSVSRGVTTVTVLFPGKRPPLSPVRPLQV